MFKTHEKSRFEVLDGNKIKNSERIVIQIAKKHLYTNPEGMAVFLCETVDPADYEHETVEGQLEIALEELENQKASWKPHWKN